MIPTKFYSFSDKFVANNALFFVVLYIKCKYHKERFIIIPKYALLWFSWIVINNDQL